MKVKSYKIYPTDYVLKISARDNGNEPIKPINLTARLSRIKDFWGNPYLTLTSIWYSGMLDMAKTILEEKKARHESQNTIMKQIILEKEDWIKIHERFGCGAIYWHLTRQRLEGMLYETDKTDKVGT
jgi:hypothetical protein